MEEQHVRRLIQALENYLGHAHTYFPVDTEGMQRAIDYTKQAFDNRKQDTESRLARLFGPADQADEWAKHLTKLSRPLVEYDAAIHDAFLYLDGKLL